VLAGALRTYLVSHAWPLRLPAMVPLVLILADQRLRHRAPVAAFTRCERHPAVFAPARSVFVQEIDALTLVPFSDFSQGASLGHS